LAIGFAIGKKAALSIEKDVSVFLVNNTVNQLLLNTLSPKKNHPKQKRVRNYISNTYYEVARSAGKKIRFCGHFA